MGKAGSRLALDSRTLFSPRASRSRSLKIVVLVLVVVLVLETLCKTFYLKLCNQLESNRWPIIAIKYMTVALYVGAVSNSKNLEI